jgi:hypothetical protein
MSETLLIINKWGNTLRLKKYNPGCPDPAIPHAQ